MLVIVGKVLWQLVLSWASDKAKLKKKFSKNSNLDDQGFSSAVFFSRTNWKLHNIFVVLTMVKIS